MSRRQRRWRSSRTAWRPAKLSRRSRRFRSSPHLQATAGSGGIAVTNFASLDGNDRRDRRIRAGHRLCGGWCVNRRPALRGRAAATIGRPCKAALATCRWTAQGSINCTWPAARADRSHSSRTGGGSFENHTPKLSLLQFVAGNGDSYLTNFAGGIGQIVFDVGSGQQLPGELWLCGRNRDEWSRRGRSAIPRHCFRGISSSISDRRW